MLTNEEITYANNALRERGNDKRDFIRGYENHLDMMLEQEPSLEALKGAARQQIDLAKHVLETGEPYITRTRDGQEVRIDDTNANELYETGVLIMIPILYRLREAGQEQAHNLNAILNTWGEHLGNPQAEPGEAEDAFADEPYEEHIELEEPAAEVVAEEPVKDTPKVKRTIGGW